MLMFLLCATSYSYIIINESLEIYVILKMNFICNFDDRRLGKSKHDPTCKVIGRLQYLSHYFVIAVLWLFSILLCDTCVCIYVFAFKYAK